MAEIASFIDTERARYPELESKYEELGNLYESKLWHQLSIALESFLQDSTNCRDDNLSRLYSEFISKFEARLSQVRLATIVSTIGQSFTDPAQAIDLYQTVLKSRTRLGAEASLCVEMDIVIAQLRLGQIDGAKDLLDTAKQTLPTLSSTETVVSSKFYRALAEYRKV